MAEETNKEEKEEKETGPENSPKSLSPMILLLLVVNVLGMGLGGYLAYLGTIGLTPEVVREMAMRELIYNEEVFSEKPVTYSLDPFTVNLAHTDDQKSIQIKITLEMLNEEGFEEVTTIGSHARDAIFSILNSKEFTELQTIQGKLFLKDEITVALNKKLKRSFVKDVYFSRFFMQ